MRGWDEIIALWEHIFGEERGDLSLASGYRPHPGDKNEDFRHQYFKWPEGVKAALECIESEARQGREVYFCAHLLTDRRRVKENAAHLSALYVDGDGTKVPVELPQPTAVVESSPGREQYYWRLSRPVEPEHGELLNKRLAYAMGADKSGWDLTQLLRPPRTINHKYASTPTVALREISNNRVYDADELQRMLPPLPEEDHKQDRTTAELRPDNDNTDKGGFTEIEIRRRLRLARRSKRGEEFKRHFDDGDASGHRSRSEAHIALMGQLAFWFEKDVEAMIRVFKHSALWENAQRTEEYLRHTAEKAAANCTKGYDPKYERENNLKSIRESLRAFAVEQPWEGRGGPMDFAIFWALINTEGARMCDEGLIVAPGVAGLSMTTGATRPDTVCESLRRIEEERGLIRKLERSHGRHADRFLILKPPQARDTRINLPSCVTSCITVLCRIRNPAPSTDKTFDKNGKRIPRSTSCHLTRPLGKLSALVIAKVYAYGRLEDVELCRSLRRSDTLKSRSIRDCLDAGLIARDGGGALVSPDDPLERILRELEETGCTEAERLRGRRFAIQRESWEEGRLRFLYGESPEETNEAQILTLRAQGEAEKRVEGDVSENVREFEKPEYPYEDTADSPTEEPTLTPSELNALEAILAYERARGPGSFSWDRAGAKKLFYSKEGGGQWPENDELEHIRDYLAATGGRAVAA